MNILWISDFDLRGSGYLNISVPLCDGLSKLGHKVRAAGLGYKGQEHTYSFSIIPARGMADVMSIAQNLHDLKKFDIMITALDVPVQMRMLASMGGRDFKYIGIFPIESDPLMLPWAQVLLQMDKALVISEFGLNEATKAGVFNAEHLEIGIDQKSWRPPTKYEKENIRHSFGIDDEEIIILTIADNQERKNLAAGLETFSEFKKSISIKSRYVLVTRENNVVGWNLRDYARILGINQDIMIFERGMEFKKLWSIYACSDIFMLPSKAEGLGMPILEAMSMKIPVLGTDCTAIHDHLKDGRGYLIPPEYVENSNPFGNAHRYWVDKSQAAKILLEMCQEADLDAMTDKAKEYVSQKTWDIAVNHLDRIIKEI